MTKIKSIREILRKYNYILTPSQKKQGLLVIIMTLIGAICETLGVSIILPLVQVILAPQQLRDNTFLKPIIDILQLETDVDLMLGISIAVILVYLIKNLFLLLLSYVRVKYSCKIQQELSIEMLESYMTRGYVFFLNASVGELLRGVSNSITNTYNGLYHMFKLLAEVMTISLICIYIMFSDIVMAMGVIILAAVCLLFITFVCQKKVKKGGEIFYKYTALINKTLLQTFQGIKEILVMQRQKFFVSSYKHKYYERQRGYIVQTLAAESPTYIIEAICVSGMIIIVFIKAIRTSDVTMLMAQLSAFAMAAFRILPSLGRISSYYSQFMFCLPGINDTYNNFKEVRGNTQKTDLQVTPRSSDSGIDFIDKVSVEHISWSYPGTNKKILDDVSLEINKGQSLAFIGKSGAGKTTLGDVILGLLIPQTGRIKIDGIDIMDIPEERSKLVGFVPQSVNLLDDTIRRNVAFGIEDEKIDDEKVWCALEQAQLKGVIEACPQGLDTEIGDRGIRFSGGQRQRLAIARALYDNPDIMILDEATSALDNETEEAVMDAIESLKGKKTLIIIAHRLTTIRNCDIIYEISDGKALTVNREQLFSE